MKITANRAIIMASIVIMAAFVLTYNRDYRWIGHVVAGVAILGFLAGTLVCGMMLAGRIKRPLNPGRFILHRKLGLAIGFIAISTFLYGLWIMLPQGKNLLETWHGWFGVTIVILSLAQIVPSIIVKNRKAIKALHRWTAYLLSGVVIFQVILGIIMLPMFARSTLPPRFSLPWQAPMEEDWRPDGILGSKEYHTSRMVDNGNFEIQYRNDGKYFYVGVKVKTTGWVGVGIERGEGMQNAGIVFGNVSEGKVTVIDSFGVGPFKHLPDTELGGTNDIVEFGGKEEDGLTIIEFKMPLFTGDKYDVPLAPGVNNIIWAYGAADVPQKHITQGRLEVNLESR